MYIHMDKLMFVTNSKNGIIVELKLVISGDVAIDIINNIYLYIELGLINCKTIVRWLFFEFYNLPIYHVNRTK